jgi:hypothetical protein
MKPQQKRRRRMRRQKQQRGHRVEQDLKDFLTALNAFIAAPTAAGGFALLILLAKLAADIGAALPGTQVEARHATLAGKKIRELRDDLEHEAAGTPINLGNILAIIIAIGQALLPILLKQHPTV